MSKPSSKKGRSAKKEAPSIGRFFQSLEDFAGKYNIITNILFFILAYGIPTYFFPEHLRWLAWPIIALLLLISVVFLYKNRFVYKKLQSSFQYLGLFAFLVLVPCIVASLFIFLTSKPDVAEIKPAEGFMGEVVKIYGSNFDLDKEINVVEFDGIKASVNSVEQGSPLMIIEAKVPQGLESGSVDITVSKKIFRIGRGKFKLIGKPLLKDFKPTKGFAAKDTFGGTRISITGENFDKRRGRMNSNFVTIGGQIATVKSVKEVDDDVDEITVVVPEDVEEGAQKIVVKTPAGEKGLDKKFTVLGKPTITDFEPKKGFKPKGNFPGTKVTVTGTNFDDETKINTIVKINKSVATVFKISENEIVFYVPAEVAVGLITVETPADRVQSVEQFKLIGAPKLKRFYPWSAAADATVTIEGENFDSNNKDNNTVKFGKVAAIIDYVNPEGTLLRVEVPKRADDCDISVTTPSDTETSKYPFKISPLITYFEPPYGKPKDPVKVYGYGFAKIKEVKIGDLKGDNISVTKESKEGERLVSFEVPSKAKTGKITVAIDEYRKHTHKDYFYVHRKIDETSFIPRSTDYPLFTKMPRKRYTTDFAKNMVVATDLTSSMGAVKAIKVGESPTDIAVHPLENWGKAYVTNFGDSSISVIDVNKDITVDNIPYVSINPARIKILGEYIHVLDRGNPKYERQSTVTSILLNDYSERHTNDVGYWALDMVAVPKANWLYVISTGDPSKKESGRLTRISAEQPTMVTSIEIGIDPKRMVVGKEGKGYITNFGDDKISVINVFGESKEIEVIKEIVLEGAAPFDIAIHPKKPEAFVTENKLGTVAVINTNKDTVIKKIPVGNNPSGIAFSPDGTLAFVVNSKDKTVTEINAATFKVVGNPIVLDGAEYPVDIYISGKHGIVTDGKKSHIIEIATK